MRNRLIRTNARQPGPARRGVVLMEMLIVLPALFVGTLAIFEFALLGVALQLVVTAATEGARTAALVGATTADVEDRIALVLNVQGILLVAGEAGAQVDYNGSSTQFGDATIVTAPRVTGPSPNAGETRVTVCVPALILNNRPVPNWLAAFGLDLSTRVIHYTALTVLE
jgi:hypothetical protein